MLTESVQTLKKRGIIDFYRTMTVAMLLIFSLGMLYCFIRGMSLAQWYREFYLAGGLALLMFIASLIIAKIKTPFPGENVKPSTIYITYAALTAVCLIISFVYIYLVRFEPVGDYARFWVTACDIASGRPIRDAWYIAAFPHLFGYSSFLGAFIRVFGESEMLAPVLNVLLTTASGSLIYFICLKNFGFSRAVLAYALWIIYPSKTMYNSFVLSEPLYTCLILLFIFLLSQLEHREDKYKGKLAPILIFGVLGGLILRAVNATRPVAAIVIIAMLLWIFLVKRSAFVGVKLKFWLPLFALMIAVYGLSGAAYDAHFENRVGERPAAFPGYSMYVGFNPQTLGTYVDDDMDLLTQYRNETGSADTAQRMMFDEFKKRLASDEQSFIYLFKSKLTSFAGSDDAAAIYSREVFSEKTADIICNAFYFYLILMAAFAAARCIRRPGDSCLNIAPMYVLGLTMAHMLVEVAGRYHYSMIPMLILTAVMRPLKTGEYVFSKA